jgi:NAD(P)-dependent dehydrogenase (short-subunit alcohol dehydrogenase family)
VTDKTQVANALELACNQLGTPKYLFTCAGISIPGMFLETPLEIFESEMQLNYFGTLYILKVNNEKREPHHSYKIIG